MSITPTPGQEAWLGVHVASGDFSLIEEAARQFSTERIAQRDDLAWAKPHVDEALADGERCEIVTLEAHKAHDVALLESLKAS